LGAYRFPILTPVGNPTTALLPPRRTAIKGIPEMALNREPLTCPDMTCSGTLDYAV
jgi:hypothetical protein